MTPEALVVFGSGGHAKVVVEAVRARTPDRTILILDDEPQARGRELLGIHVAGGRELLSERLDGAPVALAIGDNGSRAHVMAWLLSRGYKLEAIAHPSAVIGATASIGIGAFVGAGAMIVADARIGAGAIVNTAASIDHDCVVGDAAHIAPGVRLCGNVHVGARTLIGVGSCVRPGIKIAGGITIGAGTVVVGDLIEAGTYVGNPARRLR